MGDACDLVSSATRVVLLGRLSIDRAGGANPSASLPGGRAELVFAYLAAEHRRTVSRDELADALWPERLPDTWAAALRSVMSDVRRFLEDSRLDPGETLITGRSGGYRLRLPDDVVVDLDEARAQLAEARECLSAGDAGRAAASARQAADLSALPFLPQHEGAWVDGVRDELRAIHARSLELQVHALAETGDWRAAARVAERLVRAEPFSEPAHQLRISVLADGDDIAGAIKAYDHCKAVLAAELAVEPSSDTKAVLRRALRRADAQPPAATRVPDPAAAQDAPAPTPAAAPFAHLSVLVVEDHPFQRRTALALLRGLGVGTLADAPDGNAALELLADSELAPDVIVCDIDMPGMDGVEFIRRVAERGLASAIAIASALDRRLLNAVQSVSEGYGLQVLGSVEKPLTARRLSELLEAYRAPQRHIEGDDRALSSHALSDALGHDRIVADFQPIVDLASGRVSAAQLLARWQQPGGSPIEQHAFEHLLEDELARRFVDRVVGLLCAQVHELDRAGDAIELWLSVPDAALADLTLADGLMEQVRSCGADPRRIVCALRAHALRRESALHVLARLRVMGFGVCLDDFAAAHVTAEQLERIPVTAVRLAEELICGAHSDPARIAILQEAIDVARSLGLPVVGGGCETGADFELLLEVGCDFGQGAVIAGAMPASRLAGWASSWTAPLTEDHR